MTLKLTLAAAALCLSAAASFAQTPPATPPATTSPAAAAATAPDASAPPADVQARSIEAAKRWAACSADAEKLCATEIAAKVKGTVGKCLDSHMTELSDTCKASRVEHAAHMKDKAAQQ